MILEKLKSVGRKLNSHRRGIAIVLALLAVVIAIGAVQASGPLNFMQPNGKGMWGMPSRPWWPMAPVPKIHIVAVEKNSTVTILTENFPEDEDFVVTMGYIYTRGIDGIEVDTFNSGNGDPQELTFTIPQELIDEFRISIRAQTGHEFPQFPYYAFNWFYNNSTNGSANGAPTEVAVEGEAGTGGEEEAVEQTAMAAEVEEEEPIPAFEICEVGKNEFVLVGTSDFPAEKLFTVKMGVMPESPKMEPYYDGQMKPRNDMGMGMHGKPPHPMPPMYPPGKEKPMPPKKIWIPYFEAGTFETGQGGELSESFQIPAELTGAYRITILMYSDDAYPYYSYNWFYNNDAVVECVD